MRLLFFVSALAGAPTDFESANVALAGGDVAGAELGYRSALAAGGIDEDVYYNLGNVLYRQERLGPAVLAWRRALNLDPRDPDAAANLDFARRSARDDVAVADPYPAWAPWQSALTAAEGEWVGAMLVGVGLMVIALRRHARQLPLVGAGGLAAAFGAFVGAGGVAEGRLPSAAVVLADEVKAQSDLGGGVELFSLHEGAEVLVVEQAAGQVLVSLGDGRRGWLSETAVGRVDPWAPMP